MITRIEATHYRCFDRLDVNLGGFGVLVGANGAGKTTLLDIPALLGDLLEQSGKQSGVRAPFLEALQPRGARASTFTDLLHKGEGERFTFAIEGRLPKAVVDALVESASGFIKENVEHWPGVIRYELGLEVFNKRDLQVTCELRVCVLREGMCRSARPRTRPTPSGFTERSTPANVGFSRCAVKGEGRQSFVLR